MSINNAKNAHMVLKFIFQVNLKLARICSSVFIETNPGARETLSILKKPISEQRKICKPISGQPTDSN